VTAITLNRDQDGITFYKEGKYSAPPTITITGGGGSGATATATIYDIHDGDVTAAESASKESFLSFIQDERMREFNMEGQRKADLLRWGIFLKVNQDMGNLAQQDSPGSAFVLSFTRVAARDVLMPIPDKEITNNQKMTQNPGW
ncbi:MAG: RagB/SusD family nutrient uptake outer membrane protein, partial [Ginsengibacter sp.]